MSSSIDPSLFRDYDIRGIYPTQLNKEVAYVLGKAVATYLQVDRIAVGYDMRLSSPELFEGFTDGLLEQGVMVINLGQISTEIHNFASGKFQFPASVVITASHNPGNYNGFKMATAGVVPLHGRRGLPEIRKLTIKQSFPESKVRGSISQINVLDEWIEHAISFIDVTAVKPLKVVVDAGNGMGGISWERVKKKLPVQIIPLYFEPDGNFPHHLADPLKRENQLDLAKIIIEQKADMGIALDGDADRMFLLDEQGNSVSGTITTALLSTALLQKSGPSAVLYNAVCGRIVPETIKKLGGTPIRVRVGHSFIKEQMRLNNGLFAGEHSGHFYFRDNFYADSSLIAGLVLIEYISTMGKSVSEIVSTYNLYANSGELNFKTLQSDYIINEMKMTYSAKAQTVDLLDGLSVWFADWWFNLRASKTESFVRLNLEAENQKLLDKRLEEVTQKLQTLGASRA